MKATSVPALAVEIEMHNQPVGTVQYQRMVPMVQLPSKLKRVLGWLLHS